MEFYSCDLYRVTAQVRKLAMEKETTPCTDQLASRSARPHNCRVHSPSFCPCGGINPSFFIPMQPLIFILDLTFLRSLPALTHLAETNCWIPQLLTEMDRKVKAQTKSMAACIFPTQPQRCFFQIRGFGVNMQRLCPTTMYSFRYERTSQITLFHFFVTFQAAYMMSVLLFLISPQPLPLSVFPAEFLNKKQILNLGF